VVTCPPEPGRPRLRGWIHAVTAPFVLAAGIVLTCRAATVLAAAVAGVFAATAAWLCTVSALYHLGAWSPGAWSILRRIDHVDMLFLIAGTYTPLAVLALHGGTRFAILAVVWAGAALGAVLSIAWTGAPRWVYVPVYLGVGWVAGARLR
jgi:hemolysin III